MSELRPFTVEHGRFLMWVCNERALLERVHDGQFERAAQGFAWTVWDHEPLIAGGITSPWRGLGEAWLLWRPGLDGMQRRAALRATRWVLDEGTRVLKLHRLQAVVQCVDTWVRFAAHFGFQHESVLYDFGPNKETFYMMVRQ